MFSCSGKKTLHEIARKWRSKISMRHVHKLSRRNVDPHFDQAGMTDKNCGSHVNKSSPEAEIS